ncbi:MAG: hypothetical protein QG594_2069 [Bacteroidota bacterium]|nr:hypothetical protein [Bacteroidota bacterium]
MSIYKIRARKKVSRQKFFNGLYAEYTGLALNENGYIDSASFNDLLDEIKIILGEKSDNEHQLYEIGKAFLDLKKNDKDRLTKISDFLGENWKTLRFQNLVRLGADIENAGLASLSRATLVGALLTQKEKMNEG